MDDKIPDNLASMVLGLPKEQQDRIMGGFAMANRMLAGESFPPSETGGQMLDLTGQLAGVLYTNVQVIGFLRKNFPTVLAKLNGFINQEEKAMKADSDA